MLLSREIWVIFWTLRLTIHLRQALILLLLYITNFLSAYRDAYNLKWLHYVRKFDLMSCMIWFIVLAWHLTIYCIEILYQFQDGRTPLLLAIAGCHVDMVKILLKKGADVLATDIVSQRNNIQVHVCIYTNVCAGFSLKNCIISF